MKRKKLKGGRGEERKERKKKNRHHENVTSEEQVREGRRKRSKLKKKTKKEFRRLRGLTDTFVHQPVEQCCCDHYTRGWVWHVETRSPILLYIIYRLFSRKLEQKVRLSSCRSQWLETPAVCVVSSRLIRVERYFQL